MRDALAKTGRPIFYSLCNKGVEDMWAWGNKTGNSWRTTKDIKNSFDSVKKCFLENALHPESAGPGGWNDPDMLEIGNGGLNETEE